MRTTYQDAEGIREDYASGEVITVAGDRQVAQLALDYLSALAALNQLHLAAIRALGRGTDVAVGDVFSVTGELL